LLLAWKWELIGAIMALAAYVIDGIVNYAALAVFPVALAALLYLTCWELDRRRLKQAGAGANPQ